MVCLCYMQLLVNDQGRACRIHLLAQLLHIKWVDANFSVYSRNQLLFSVQYHTVGVNDTITNKFYE